MHRNEIRPGMPKWGIVLVAQGRRTSPSHRHTFWASTAPSKSGGSPIGREMARGREDAPRNSPTYLIMEEIPNQNRVTGLPAPSISLRQDPPFAFLRLALRPSKDP